MSQITSRRRPLGKRERIHIDPRNPRALALCDGCKMPTFRDTLTMQMDYRGTPAPVPLGFLVCPRCLDVPNAQGAPAILPIDPVPIIDPRPDDSGIPWLITSYGGIFEAIDPEPQDPNVMQLANMFVC